jgi:hypothetical protein
MKSKTKSKEVDSVELGKQALARLENEKLQRQNSEQSLADRLMNAVVDTPLRLPFKDAQGEFTVLCRRFTWEEQNKLKAIHDASRQPDQLQNVSDLLLELLAYPSGVCLDASLNLAFWKAGKYSQALPAQIINAVQSATTEEIQAARTFRSL